jgi:hypothetical protein
MRDDEVQDLEETDPLMIEVPRQNSPGEESREYTRETKRRWWKGWSAHGPPHSALRRKHGVGARLSFGRVRGGNGVNDGLGFLMADL